MVRSNVWILGFLAATYAANVATADESEAEQLAKALRSSVDVASGRQPVRHCRQGSRSWDRCDARLEAFAAAFVASGRRHGVPPVVLAAIAVGESGLNPGAVGARGELGIMQLHPRGVGARLTCRDASSDACQAEVVELAAEHLAGWRARCSSDLEALGGYNSGRCVESDYARRVVSRARRIGARAAGGDHGGS